jgi:hypothetical protein
MYKVLYHDKFESPAELEFWLDSMYYSERLEFVGVSKEGFFIFMRNVSKPIITVIQDAIMEAIA